MYTKERNSAGTDEKVMNQNDDELDEFYCIRYKYHFYDI